MKVLIIDDNKLYVDGLELSLNYLFNNVTIKKYNDGKFLTMENVLEFDPKIIILDISMQKVSGLSALKEIRAKGLKTPILMLSMHDKKEYLSKSKEFGANGFLLKDSDFKEIEKAINILLDGDNYFIDIDYD